MGPTLLSQLAHVELTTPKFEESLTFWTEVVGLEETARGGADSAYLRAWGDRFHHTLQLTEGPETGLGHIGWRAAERAVRSASRRPARGGRCRRGLERGLGRSWPRLPLPRSGRPPA